MGKQIRKLIGTLLLVTAIVVTQIPVSGVEAEEPSAAPEFQVNGTTLVKYNGTAEDVSVPNQVKRIEAEAFAGNDTVRHVTVGEAVEVIGAKAFSECPNLQSVTIPDSVEIIENAAFSGCPSLRSVSIGTGLKSLGNGAFAGDYSLATVNIDSSNPDFVCDDGAIYNKKGWDVLYQVLAGRGGDSYSMPSSVNKIRPYAFWGDYNLQNVSISSNVSEITGYAFSNCKNLKEVSIPHSVKGIDMKAFEDCVRLREITIPISVSNIHATAFDGCTKLTINGEAGSYAKRFAETLVLDDIDVSEYEEAPIPGREYEEELEEGQILGPVDYYHEVSHMNAMEAEEDDPRVKAKSRVIGQEVYVLVDNAKATVNVGSTGEILGGEPVVEEPDLDTIPGLAGSEDAKGGSFPKYTVVNGETIASQAYYDEDMTSCDIPSGIRRIGEFAYARASLTSVRIPDGVEEIGYAAFYHCDELTDVVIPNSVSKIGVSAFDKTPWLSGWKANAGEEGEFLIVGDGILLAYRGNGGDVSIPDSVKKIGPEAFRGLSSITAVRIPDSVQEIGEGAFENCDKLERIDGGEGLHKICDRAFAGCPVSSVYIGPSVESIGLRAFDNEKIKNGVVYFAGETLPARSYESAATKLYRDTYRGPVFTGTRVAVIPAGVTDLTDTCLSSAGGAFTGVICKVKGSEATADGSVEGGEASEEEASDAADRRSLETAQQSEDEEQSASARQTADESQTETAEDENPVLTILRKTKEAPAAGETVEINGDTYTLEEAEPGSVSLADAERSMASASEIEVVNNSYSIPREGTLSAVMEGSEGSYRIAIEDSEDAKAKISEVYQSIYGGKLPHSLHAYEITMTDQATDVPITGLGKQRVEITMPLPQGVLTENLHVVCLDSDGQLEEVDSRVVSVDGQDAVAFTAAHFSAYGIYHYGSGPAVADVKEGQAVFLSLGKKDDSPDTGDYSIHPKYILVAGLFFSSMAVFFYQKRSLLRLKRRLVKPFQRKRR